MPNHETGVAAEQWKWRLKDTLQVIALGGNILLLVASLFGLMKWMSSVDTRLTAIEMTNVQVADKLRAIDVWKDESKTKWTAHDAVENEKKTHTNK